MGFLFEPYTENDFADLKDMVFGLYDEDHEGLPVTEDKIVKTISECMDHPEKVRIIMIRAGGISIGYGIVTFWWSNEYGGNAVTIDELFIRKTHRYKNAAADFIKHVRETYKDAALLEVETTPSNVNALRLYKKLGFTVSENTHLVLSANNS